MQLLNFMFLIYVISIFNKHTEKHKNLKKIGKFLQLTKNT